MKAIRLFFIHLFAMIIFIPVCSIADSMNIQVYNLQTKTADQLIPTIQPMLPQGSVVTGNQYQLVIKTTQDGFNQIQPIIAKLDEQQQMLIISVRRVHNADYDKTSSSNNTVESISSQPSDRNDTEQKISVLDGQKAFIKTGESIPLQNYQVSIFGAGSNTEYKNITSGFYVLPKLNGNTVMLKIFWKYNQLQADQSIALQDQSPIDIEQSDSTLVVPLGAWSSLSNTSSQSLSSENADQYSTQDVAQPDKNVFIKVELAPNPNTNRARFPQGQWGNGNTLPN